MFLSISTKINSIKKKCTTHKMTYNSAAVGNERKVFRFQTFSGETILIEANATFSVEEARPMSLQSHSLLVIDLILSKRPIHNEPCMGRGCINTDLFTQQKYSISIQKVKMFPSFIKTKSTSLYGLTLVCATVWSCALLVATTSMK